MARATQRLTALKVEKAKEPGMYPDGGASICASRPRAPQLGAALHARSSAAVDGAGSLALYGLQEARAKALDARRKRHEGIDPIEARRAERARQRLDAAKAITFKQCAEAYINSHRAGWRMASTRGNGVRRFPPTPILSSGRFRCRQ